MPARRKGQHRARHHINPNKPSVFAKLPPLPAKEDTMKDVTKDAIKDAATMTATPAAAAATTTAQMPVEAQIEDATTVGA